MRVLLRPEELRALAAPYAELMNAPIPQDVPSAAHDRRVRELRTQIIITQVRMRIEMHDMEVFVALSERTHDGKRHEMLAADHEGLLAIGEQVPRKVLDLP